MFFHLEGMRSFVRCVFLFFSSVGDVQAPDCKAPKGLSEHRGAMSNLASGVGSGSNDICLLS